MTETPEPSAPESVSARATSHSPNQLLLAAVILAGLVLITYWPAHSFDFVNYDDEAGILETPGIRNGVTWQNVKWAFTHVHMGNWQPLTNLSHMLDCQLFGLHAGPAHIENVLLHAINTVLLLLVLLKATGHWQAPNSNPESFRGKHQTSGKFQVSSSELPSASEEPARRSGLQPSTQPALNHQLLIAPKSGEGGSTINAIWPCAFVAALFGLHPLHVESVAWISERKDVLSTFFFLLTLLAYVRYVKKSEDGSSHLGKNPESRIPNPKSHARRHLRSSIFYLLALGLFALGVMTKPMLVTLPFILLLLDFWPLGHFRPSTINSQLSPIRKLPTTDYGLETLLIEKIPFLVLSIAASLITFFSQAHAQAIESVSYLPVGSRVANAFISYIRYIEKMFWPNGLIAFYPRVPVWLWWQVVGAVVLLAGITFFAVRSARNRPYLAVGWFWYVITLLPVIGLLQVGAQSMADRYTYIPLIGLFIVLSWGAAELIARWHIPAFVVAGSAAVCVVICSVLSHWQVLYWENSIALFRHMLDVMPNNAVAHNNLGSALYRAGRSDEAIAEFEAALRISPVYDDANNNMGLAEFRRGRNHRAADYFEAVLSKGPNLKALYNLGVVRVSEGDLQGAAQCYAAALRLKPDCAEAHYGLADILAGNGKIDEAIEHYEAAVKAQPELAAAQNNLAALLLRQGRPQEAFAHSLEAIRVEPTLAEAYYNAGNALLLQKNFTDAEKFYLDALRLNTNYVEAHQNLGVVYEKLSRNKDAAEQYAAIVRLRPDYAAAFNRLAQVRARLGDFTNAIAAAEQGMRAATAAGQNDLAAQLRDSLGRYREGKP